MTQSLLTERITRLLAFMLRHEPEQFDIEVDAFGFADVEDVLDALSERLDMDIDNDGLIEAIEAGDRQRYEIQGDRIRALYGHSIPVEPGEPTQPPQTLYVGLALRDAERAAKYGLRGGRRRFLHLALTEEDARETGRRAAEEYCVITVHALDAWEDGVNFFDRKSLFLAEEIPTELLDISETYDDGQPPMRGGGRSRGDNRGGSRHGGSRGGGRSRGREDHRSERDRDDRGRGRSRSRSTTSQEVLERASSGESRSSEGRGGQRGGRGRDGNRGGGERPERQSRGRSRDGEDRGSDRGSDRGGDRSRGRGNRGGNDRGGNDRERGRDASEAPRRKREETPRTAAPVATRPAPKKEPAAPSPGFGLGIFEEEAKATKPRKPKELKPAKIEPESKPAEPKAEPAPPSDNFGLGI